MRHSICLDRYYGDIYQKHGMHQLQDDCKARVRKTRNLLP